jgi:small membrane protein
MDFSMYKLLVPLFAVCMIAKAASRFRRHQRTVRELVVWIIIWSGISFAALFPDFTMYWFTVLTGIKSGFYAIIFFMLVLLSYGYLTLFVKLEDMERMLTELVRKLALRELQQTMQENSGERTQPPPGPAQGA